MLRNKSNDNIVKLLSTTINRGREINNKSKSIINKVDNNKENINKLSRVNSNISVISNTSTNKTIIKDITRSTNTPAT